MRPFVFWPPAIVLIAALIFSLVDFDAFHAGAGAANRWLISRFDWLFMLASFAAVGLVFWVAWSPLGAVRIGGPKAKPILSRVHWFSITLCTTIATGILFWGAAEPMFHVSAPPQFENAAPHSPESARFALSTLYMHWTITPYAIYTIPALAFALAHFNLGRGYSLSGPLSLLFGRYLTPRGADVIDALGLTALIAGVAASLGAGVMTIAGGFHHIAGLHDGALMRFFVTAAIVALFVVSSISGIQRGIKFLSSWNTRFFFFLLAFIALFGPTSAIISLWVSSLGDYITSFVPNSLSLGARANDAWTRDWTVFYFANWLAWAPVTALFLGRIAVGYSVREFLLINLLAPAAFGMVWMSVIGGAAIEINKITGRALSDALQNDGPEAVIYVLLETLPLTGPLIIGFVGLTFISFVTAMDSNTHSIASLCVKSRVLKADNQRASRWVKIFWGALIGAIAWVMTSTTGIEGMRMLSNLGGAPGLLILILMGAALIAMRIYWLDEISAAAQPAADKAASIQEKRPDEGSGRARD